MNGHERVGQLPPANTHVTQLRLSSLRDLHELTARQIVGQVGAVMDATLEQVLDRHMDLLAVENSPNSRAKIIQDVRVAAMNAVLDMLFIYTRDTISGGLHIDLINRDFGASVLPRPTYIYTLIDTLAPVSEYGRHIAEELLTTLLDLIISRMNHVEYGAAEVLSVLYDELVNATKMGRVWNATTFRFELMSPTSTMLFFS